MKRLLLFVVLVAVTGCVSHDLPSPAVRGREIARQNCSSCHAIGPFDDSPAPEAPPFRTLSANYRVDTLQEALAEGISVGHPAMPQFEFAPQDADALIAYLQSIQESPADARSSRH